MDNFDLMFEIYSSFHDYQAGYQAELDTVLENFQDLSEKFLKLFTAEQYRTFINTTDQAANVLKSLTYDISLGLSYQKADSNEILYTYTMGS